MIVSILTISHIIIYTVALCPMEGVIEKGCTTKKEAAGEVDATDLESSTKKVVCLVGMNGHRG